MKKIDFKFIFSSFFLWRTSLFIFLFLAFKYLPLQNNFLGGGITNYLAKPYLWSWLNFDGEHYLSIVYQGYLPLTYFYFPLFPILAKVISFFLNFLLSRGMEKMALSGLIVSNLSFFTGLIFLWKLLKLDFKENIIQNAVLLLILFPTSFYFGSFYTESLFFLLTILSFYFARKGNWLLAGIFGGLSTATRITGLALLPAFLIEIWQNNKDSKEKITKLIYPLASTLLIPLGLIFFMFYQWKATGDPLNFLNQVFIFGSQRSSNFILLPQVFYRYFFKIIPSLNYSYLPVVFTTFMELIVALLFLATSIIAFLKLRLSYALYLTIGYLIPTLSGSFSSLPRYVLILFPGFLLFSLYFDKIPKSIQFLILFLLTILLGFSTMLFARGYWVS